MAGVLQYALSLKTGQFDGPVKTSTANLDQFRGAAAGGTSSLAGFAAGAASAAGVLAVFAGATRVALGVLESYAEFDGLVRGLKTIEGTAADTQARLELLRDVAKLPGLGFEEAVRGDVRLRAVGLSAERSEQILRNFGNAIATVGGGKAELDGVILALGQIQSKGKISTEEINQLAERVPQVRAAIKDAFGTSDIEALGKSTLSTTEFIDGLVESLGKLPKVTGGAQNTIDNYNDSWKSLTNTANEFAVGISSSWIDSVSGAFQQAARDLKSLQELLGISTPGLGGEDGAGKDLQAYRKAKADKLAVEEAAAASSRAVAAADAAFFEAKDQERAEFEKARAADRVEIEKQAADRVRAAQEKVFEARLTEEANLQRKLAALRAVGPSGAGAINQTADPVVKSVIAERTAEIVTLEARLAEIKAGALVTDQAARKEAEGKLAVAAREAKAAGDAARLFAQEGAILEARANGQTKVVAALERQAKVEALKLELMEKQGLADTAAAAAAEKRVALEERAARPRRGLLDAAASFARRTAARSAADVTRDERLGRTGSNTDRLALADLQRRQNRPLSPAAAAAQLARGTGAADPGKNRREERAKAEEKAANPLLAVVKEIQEKLSNLATA